ncbi:hypothetical protein [Paenibacillus monticola]|uniref:Lipoprotein n=1 Tax=Paenibacillus monticola TaxID=2666075 RepID=A0A7X2H2E6_9BACL|nr:hypothetical protein [Paenibacillus monticola]MRN52302.1 hypothetical protein [Paenibacillus monticola]
MKKGILAVLFLGVILMLSACNSNKNDMNKGNTNVMSNTNTEMKGNMNGEEMMNEEMTDK